jgi:hypothetical protein
MQRALQCPVPVQMQVNMYHWRYVFCGESDSSNIVVAHPPPWMHGFGGGQKSERWVGRRTRSAPKRRRCANGTFWRPVSRHPVGPMARALSERLRSVLPLAFENGADNETVVVDILFRRQ